MAQSMKQLGEERNAIAVKMRAMLDTAENDNSPWTSEQDAEYSKMTDAIVALDAKMDRLGKLEEIEAKAGEVPRNARELVEKRNDDLASLDRDERDHMEAFQAFIRRGEKGLTEAQSHANAERVGSIQNALQTDTDIAGGFTVPVTYMDKLLEKMAEYGGVRDCVQVIQTADGRPQNWSKTDDTQEEGELLSEGSSATDDDFEFGLAIMGAHLFSSKVVTVSHQLLRDSRFDLDAHIQGRLSRRLQRVTNRLTTVGTGVNQPEGVVTGAGVGKVSALVDGVQFDDFIDLEHSIDPAYRESPKCKYMFHDQTLKVIRKMKDGENRPLWQPDVQGGVPALFNGREYAINQHMPQLAADAKAILFGDFDQYILRDVMDSALFFRFTDSAYSKKAQVGFMAFIALDGRYISAAEEVGGNVAVRAIQNASS